MIGMQLNSVEIDAGVTKQGILFRFVLPLQSDNDYRVGNAYVIGVPVYFVSDLLREYEKEDDFDSACVGEVYDISNIRGYGKILYIRFPATCSHEKHDDDKVIYTIVVTWVNLVTRLLEMI